MLDAAMIAVIVVLSLSTLGLLGVMEKSINKRSLDK